MPIDAILFRMHEKGLKQADLAPYFGTTSRVSEVLNEFDKPINVSTDSPNPTDNARIISTVKALFRLRTEHYL
jgi:hypothetical protein